MLLRTLIFSVVPSPVGVNQAFQISWVYDEGDSPNGFFAVEVQGEDGYLGWHGFYNSSGSTSAEGVPSTGAYTLAAYSNAPGAETGTFFTMLFTVGDQEGSQSSSTVMTTSRTAATSSSTTSTPTFVSPSTMTTSSASFHSTTAPITSVSSSTPSVSGGTTLIPTTTSLAESSIPSLPATPPPAASSSPPPSVLSSRTKTSVIVAIGASSGVGALLFFVIVGLCVHIRRRRKIDKTQMGKIAPTPYEFAYPRQFSSDSSQNPSLQIRPSKDAHLEVAPQRTQIWLNRIPEIVPNRRKSHPAQPPLSQDTGEMGASYDSEVDPPSYSML